ncbi:hypothetical protein [Williamsia sp. CHRR-6]|uniref:hypothetical protein n=1 Tax=Williamsia sp. CHRR-6 TaxID=2835871 RepID=UPI001BDA8D88|nr:hypothetical protein [Williamsia sp. CHRR-6]MBT0567663.1 hypothetical protein [Williamsia sp. CHRR-6]
MEPIGPQARLNGVGEGSGDVVWQPGLVAGPREPCRRVVDAVQSCTVHVDDLSVGAALVPGHECVVNGYARRAQTAATAPPEVASRLESVATGLWGTPVLSVAVSAVDGGAAVGAGQDVARVDDQLVAVVALTARSAAELDALAVGVIAPRVVLNDAAASNAQQIAVQAPALLPQVAAAAQRAASTAVDDAFPVPVRSRRVE